jgi:protein RecA
MTDAGIERRRPQGAAPPAAPSRRRPATEVSRPAEPEGRTGGLYFASEKTHLQFIHSGSTMLDCALGGGWVLGRVANIIGDKSTGKTLLAIEACANFAKAYPRGKVFFRERESAFDKKYAEAFGLPMDRVDFGPETGAARFDTVEGFHDDLLQCIDKAKRAKQPAIYVLDSFDALSAAAEMDRKITDASYGGDRAKKMSELFRRLIRPLEDNDVLLMIISQIRDNIGAMFGKKTKRMGGHALDFYATHVIELAHLGYVPKTINGVKRDTGIDVKALVSKNKVGLTHRDVEFEIQFGYGVEDLTSCLDWLIEVGRIGTLGLNKDSALRFLKETNNLPDAEYRLRVKEVTAAAKVAWREIEYEFLPKRRKY